MDFLLGFLVASFLAMIVHTTPTLAKQNMLIRFAHTASRG